MKRELALALNFCLLGLIAWLPNTYSKITVHGVSPPLLQGKDQICFCGAYYRRLNFSTKPLGKVIKS